MPGAADGSMGGQTGRRERRRSTGGMSVGGRGSERVKCLYKDGWRGLHCAAECAGVRGTGPAPKHSWQAQRNAHGYGPRERSRDRKEQRGSVVRRVIRHQRLLWKALLPLHGWVASRASGGWTAVRGREGGTKRGKGGRHFQRGERRRRGNKTGTFVGGCTVGTVG